jgi:seryl-tRNA synthetase
LSDRHPRATQRSQRIPDQSGAQRRKWSCSGTDIEAWFPGQQRYREITSTSNTTDFQSRRLEIRFRRAGKPEPVHTLNGTAITARAMIAILENFQEADGSITVPRVLWEFGAPRQMGSK